VRFEFATASRIVCGPGCVAEAAPAAAALGRRPLVVTGRDPARAAPLIEQLRGQGLAVESYPVDGEPTVETIAEATELARASGADCAVGIGGGSVVDAAKAVAALIANDGELYDYLEVIGRGRALERPAAPCIAIPTTAGTGAEVTRNAVIAATAERVKVSLRSAHMLPDLALVDPELTHGLPPAITASTGLDALAQLIEPFVSPAAQPLTDALCAEGLARAARSLVPAYRRDDPGAREELAQAALFSGLALANAKLGAVHGIAGPFGGMFPGAPHGAVCGRLLAPVMRVNLRALEEREPTSPALARFAELGRLLTGEPTAGAAEAVAWIERLCDELATPPLGSYGPVEDELPQLVEASQRASSMRGNPIALTDAELEEILRAAG
jgi:alcohol dehydrogenase class IV